MFDVSTVRGAARVLDAASEAAERCGWPALARDLAVALVTLQRFGSDYGRLGAAPDTLPVGSLDAAAVEALERDAVLATLTEPASVLDHLSAEDFPVSLWPVI